METCAEYRWFLDEARLATRICHPNVVPTVDVNDTPDLRPYIAMEYVEGHTVAALLQQAWKLGRRMPFPIALRISVDALKGLAAGHSLTDCAYRAIVTTQIAAL
jgi:serine/threonine protein kinase